MYYLFYIYTRLPTATCNVSLYFLCRYTECRLQPLAAAALLADLDSDTVDFLPNFDASVVSIAGSILHLILSLESCIMTCCAAIIYIYIYI